jgi:glycerol uptake facilitator-like aquaporin
MDWGSIVPQAIAAFFGALAAYMAIREDIAVLKANAKAHADSLEDIKSSVTLAHQRIDRVIEK